MKHVYHQANTRGTADHGWLKSFHTFSFAGYHNPDRMHFGVLRVLNDDAVAGGQGFGKHPHQNMEIISIPLEGDLEHKDSMGNTTVIKQGDIQVMSAGTGVHHSEYNKNQDKEVKFLQIWIFPKFKDVQPRYDQISLDSVQQENELYQVLSPNSEDQGVWIHQDAWFSMGEFTEDTATSYKLKSDKNGVYIFSINGSSIINGIEINSRDGLGIWESDTLDIKANAGAKFLLMEVPMTL